MTPPKKVNGHAVPVLRSAAYNEGVSAALRGHPLQAPVPHRPIERPTALEPAWPSLPPPPPSPPLNLPRVPEQLPPSKAAPKAARSRKTKKESGPLIVVRKQPLPSGGDPDNDGGPSAA